MNMTQLILIKLAEECGEVSHDTLKAVQFGLEDHHPTGHLSNRHRIHAELNDLMAVIEMLNTEHGLGFVPSRRAIEEKKEKVRKWAMYAHDCGMVNL